MGKPVSLLVADHDIDASYFSSNIFLIDFDGIDCAWKGVTAESSLCYATNPSLVVPAISVTIALGCFVSALSKLDFPAFGFPAIAT